MLTDITNYFPEVSCGVGVDGIYFDSNYTPLAPTFFINGYEWSDTGLGKGPFRPGPGFGLVSGFKILKSVFGPGSRTRKILGYKFFGSGFSEFRAEFHIQARFRVKN